VRILGAPYPYIEAVITIGTWSAIEYVLLDTGYDGGLVIPADRVDDIWAIPGAKKPFSLRFKFPDDFGNLELEMEQVDFEKDR
jgi:hypothetical protein